MQWCQHGVSQGSFDPLLFAAFTAVQVLWHVSVYTLNAYYGHKLGIDLENKRTADSTTSMIVPS